MVIQLTVSVQIEQSSSYFCRSLLDWTKGRAICSNHAQGASMKDIGLGLGDLPKGSPQVMNMVMGYGGYDSRPGCGHVGGIPGPSQAHFHHRPIDLPVREM